MRILAVAVLVLVSSSCFGQTTKKAEVFSGLQIKDVLSKLAQQTGSSAGSTLGAYDTHKIMLSERTASGSAEVHGHFDDIMIVMDGKATLITGGTLIAAKAGDNGETTGSGITNGTQQTISTGDIVHVPAGVPHQLIIPAGTRYSALVIKVKE